MQNLIKKNLLYISYFLSIILIGLLITEFTSLSIFMVLSVIIGFALISLITKNPFLGLLLIIFFLPFERIPTYDLGLVSIKINQVIGLITLLAVILSILFNKQKILSNPLITPIAFYLIIAFLSIFQAELPSRSIQVFVFTVFTILLGMVTVNLTDSSEKLQKIIKILFVSALITCLFALFQFFGDIIGLPQWLTGLKKGYDKLTLGFPRPQAFSMEPLYLGNYLLIPLGVGLALFLEKINIIKRSYLIILDCLMIIVLILTVARGAYFGFFFLLLTLLFFKFKNIFSLKNIMIAIVSILFVGGGVYYALNQSGSNAYDKFIEHVTISDYSNGESTQSRLKAWYDAYDAYKEKPLLGIGLGNFGPWLNGYPDPSSVEGWDIVNNEYLEILAETGILGLLSFVSIIIVLIIRSLIAYYHSRDNLLKAILIGLLAAFMGTLAQYNFFSTLYIIHVWVLIGLIVAVQNLCFKEKN